MSSIPYCFCLAASASASLSPSLSLSVPVSASYIYQFMYTLAQTHTHTLCHYSHGGAKSENSTNFQQTQVIPQIGKLQLATCVK